MSEMLETLEIFNARRGVASGILNTVWKNKFRSLKKYLNFKEIFYSIQKIYIFCFYFTMYTKMEKMFYWNRRWARSALRALCNLCLSIYIYSCKRPNDWTDRNLIWFGTSHDPQGSSLKSSIRNIGNIRNISHFMMKIMIM